MAKPTAHRLPPAQALAQLLTKGLDDHGSFKYEPTRGGGYVITRFEKTRSCELSFGKKLMASSEPTPEMQAYRVEKALNLRGAILAELGKEAVNVKTVETLAIKFGKQFGKGGVAPHLLSWGYVRGSDPARDAAFDRVFKNLTALLSPSSSQSKPISDAARPVLVAIRDALAPAEVEDTAAAGPAGSAPSRLEALKQTEQTLRFVHGALLGGALEVPEEIGIQVGNHVADARKAVANEIDALTDSVMPGPGFEDAFVSFSVDELPLVHAAIREFRMKLAVLKPHVTPAEVARARSFEDRGFPVVLRQSVVDALLQKRQELEQAARRSGNSIKLSEVPSSQTTGGAITDLQTVQMTLGRLNAQLLNLVKTVQGFRDGEKGVTEYEHHHADRAIDPVMAEIDRLEQLEKQFQSAFPSTANATTTTANLAPGPTSTTTSTATTSTPITTTTTATTTTTTATRSATPQNS